MRKSLNGGVLPDGFYALAEQSPGGTRISPNILALKDTTGAGVADESRDDNAGGLAVATVPPRVLFREALDDVDSFALRQRSLAIRHNCDDVLIAVIEIVSPANRRSMAAIDQFVEKVTGLLATGIHVLIVDLFLPGRFIPNGMRSAVWETLGSHRYQNPTGDPLTLASYSADPIVCWVQPTAIGNLLTEMPLFLPNQRYVNVPLEATYTAAFDAGPLSWKRIIESENSTAL